jgi:hypothetical protein
MYRFSEDFKFMTLCPRLLQQIGGSGLSREEKNIAFWKFTSSGNGGLDTRHALHNYIGDQHLGLEALK